MRFQLQDLPGPVLLVSKKSPSEGEQPIAADPNSVATAIAGHVAAGLRKALSQLRWAKYAKLLTYVALELKWILSKQENDTEA